VCTTEIIAEINQSINQFLFAQNVQRYTKKGFSIASRTTSLRPTLTAAQLINYTMKEKEKLNAYKIAYTVGCTYTVPGFI